MALNKSDGLHGQVVAPVPYPDTNLTQITPEPPFNKSNYDYVWYSEDIPNILEPWTNDDAFWPTVITYGVTFILGIFGNCLVVAVLVMNRKPLNVTSFFLISLAMADVAFLLICVPYETLLKLNASWTGGVVLCKIAGFVEMLTTTASVLNLMAVSIERYIVIVHPMKSRSWCTIGNTKKIIVAVWIVATLLSAPNLHIMDVQTNAYYNNATYVVTVLCMDHNFLSDRLVFAYYQLVVMFVVPVLVMLYCYSVVIHVLWSSTKELAKMTHTTESISASCEEDGVHRLQNTNKVHARASKSFLPRAVKDHSAEISDARKQVIRMLLAIIGVFFVCWGPKLVLHVLKRHELNCLYTNEAFYISLMINLLPYVHSCLNPIIYSFMSNNFRRSMRASCRKCYRCCCRCDVMQHFGGRRPRSLDFDMDSKSVNGLSRYSPTITTSCNTRCPTKPLYTIVTSGDRADAFQ